MNKARIIGAAISASLSITLVVFIARCLGITVESKTVIAAVFGLALGLVLQEWIIPAIKRYRAKNNP